MAVLMLLATLWGVVQLGVLATATRSLRLTTVLLAIGVGCYGCGVFALLAEATYTRAVHAVTGGSMTAIVRTAGYTVDPVIEECVKLAPVLLIVLVSRSRGRQRGVTDFLLLGAAVGGGFALAEALLRFGSSAARATANGQGGFMIFRGLGGVEVAGVQQLLTSWLPPPVVGASLFGTTSSGDVNLHLAYTALAAAGVGLVLRVRRPWRWCGLVPVVYGCLDHALSNYAIASPSLVGPQGLGWDLLAGVRSALPTVVLVALTATTLMDRHTLRQARAELSDVVLSSERPGLMGTLALVRQATVAPPWSFAITQRFVLARRSLWYAQASGGASLRHRQAVSEVARQLGQAPSAERWRSAAHATLGDFRRPGAVLRNWRMLAWLILVLPSFLYLVVGGVPATAGLQRLLTGPTASKVLVVWLVGGVLYLGWQGVDLKRMIKAARQLPAAEVSTRAWLSLATVVGALVGAVGVGVSWLRDGGGGGPVLPTAHILDALGVIALVVAALFLVAAIIEFPPLAAVVITAGGAALSTTTVGALAVSAELGLSAAILGTTGGVLLNKASDPRGAFPGGSKKAPPPEKGENLPAELKSRVQAKLPDDWGTGFANRTGGPGTRWFGPRPKSDSVRVDLGNPNSPLPSQRVDHVVVTHDGKLVGRHGQQLDSIKANPKEAHIPLSQWLKWTQWWRP